MPSPENPHTGSISSSQTLLRGLDVLEAVAGGTSTLKGLSTHLSLSKSTVYRLATALVSRSYLTVAARGEYRLGPQAAKLEAVSLQGVRERSTNQKALSN